MRIFFSIKKDTEFELILQHCDLYYPSRVIKILVDFSLLLSCIYLDYLDIYLFRLLIGKVNYM